MLQLHDLLVALQILQADLIVLFEQLLELALHALILFLLLLVNALHRFVTLF